jgi:transcription elongation GreA/GreB family factor
VRLLHLLSSSKREHLFWEVDMKNAIKVQLYNHCIEYVKNHIEINNRALSGAQDAVNSETKNTAGDKHETERAMKQLETETFGRRLSEALSQFKLLQTIDISLQSDSVKPGSLVYTSMGIFFIAISADEVVIDGEEYCIVSPESPIGQAMINHRAGSVFKFRATTAKIEAIY